MPGRREGFTPPQGYKIERPASASEKYAKIRAEKLAENGHRNEWVKVEGEKELKHLFIGEVIEFDDHYEVELMTGCDKSALVEHMQKMANQYGMPVQADFHGLESNRIIIEPEKSDK